MDVKVEYKLATQKQAKQTFGRFFERQFAQQTRSLQLARHGTGIIFFLEKRSLSTLSEKFVDQIPEDTFLRRSGAMLSSYKEDEC